MATKQIVIRIIDLGSDPEYFAPLMSLSGHKPIHEVEAEALRNLVKSGPISPNRICAMPVRTPGIWVRSTPKDPLEFGLQNTHRPTFVFFAVAAWKCGKKRAEEVCPFFRCALLCGFRVRKKFTPFSVWDFVEISYDKDLHYTHGR